MKKYWNNNRVFSNLKSSLISRRQFNNDQPIMCKFRWQDKEQDILSRPQDSLILQHLSFAWEADMVNWPCSLFLQLRGVPLWPFHQISGIFARREESCLWTPDNITLFKNNIWFFFSVEEYFETGTTSTSLLIRDPKEARKVGGQSCPL